MKTITTERWVELDTKLNGIKFYQLCEVTRKDDKKSTLVGEKGLDKVYIEVGNNYGNRIYTNKENANKIYKALLRGEIAIHTGVLDSFKTINQIKEYIA